MTEKKTINERLLAMAEDCERDLIQAHKEIAELKNTLAIERFHNKLHLMEREAAWSNRHSRKVAEKEIRYNAELEPALKDAFEAGWDGCLSRILDWDDHLAELPSWAHDGAGSVYWTDWCVPYMAARMDKFNEDMGKKKE